MASGNNGSDFRVASSCTTRNGLDEGGINHVEDREARKTTENNEIVLMTLRQTETNGETGSRQVQGAGCRAVPSSR